jgi:hypothetical protein
MKRARARDGNLRERPVMNIGVPWKVKREKEAHVIIEH